MRKGRALHNRVPVTKHTLRSPKASSMQTKSEKPHSPRDTPISVKGIEGKKGHFETLITSRNSKVCAN